MDITIVKKKEYEVLETLGKDVYLVTREGKKYIVRTFAPASGTFYNFLYANKMLKASGVRIPKMFAKDKKTGNILLEYIEGETVFDQLIKGPLSDEIFEDAFTQNWRARINRILLDFNPLNFRMYEGKLVYTPFIISQYVKEKDFSQTDIRLWFYTREFKELLITNGLPIDQSRLKNEYEQNKEIVLTVIKHYR